MKKGPTRTVLDSILLQPSSVAGRGDIKSIAAMVRDQQTAGVRGPPGQHKQR